MTKKTEETNKKKQATTKPATSKKTTKSSKAPASGKKTNVPDNPPADSAATVADDSSSGTKKPLLDENGKFAKGHKKVGGRQLGTKNRNSNIRDRLKEQLEPILDQLETYLLQVKQQEGAGEMLKTAEKYMPYVWPKYQSMSLTADQERPISEEQRLTELDALYTKKELSINFKTMTVVNNDKLHAVDPESDEDDFDLSIFDTVDN